MFKPGMRSESSIDFEEAPVQQEEHLDYDQTVEWKEEIDLALQYRQGLSSDALSCPAHEKCQTLLIKMVRRDRAGSAQAGAGSGSSSTTNHGCSQLACTAPRQARCDHCRA